MPTKWGEVDETEVPETEVIVDGNTKKVIEYSVKDGQLVKKTRTFLIEKEEATEGMLRRRQWKKFGAAAGKPPGPESETTSIADEVFLVLSSQSSKKQGAAQPTTEEEKKKQLKDKTIVCRLCGGSHFTTKCPYKDSISTINKIKSQGQPGPESSPAPGPAPTSDSPAANAGGAYVPPSLRSGGTSSAAPRGAEMSRPGDDSTVRVTNLSENASEQDIRELFRFIGPVTRVYVAKDKTTGANKGYAFVTYLRREDAKRAIEKLDGHGYDHLILHVDWSYPSGSRK